MSTPRINAAYEILEGMESAAYRKASMGLKVADAVWEEIEKRRAEIKHLEDEHARGPRAGMRCTCRAHEHGGDCMCFEGHPSG